MPMSNVIDVVLPYNNRLVMINADCSHLKF